MLGKKRPKRTFRYIMLFVAGLFFFACSGEKKAENIYDIAAFEEIQTNMAHARELYQEIIEKYPETETARKARRALERLPDTAEAP